jgi:hypothetical protein
MQIKYCYKQEIVGMMSNHTEGCVKAMQVLRICKSDTQMTVGTAF